jgi:4-amino-4-deoxy-L-arabinose transferase-like glycosyltransferase
VLALELAFFAFVGPSFVAGWRECDTQTIAENLAADSFNVLRPRVSWGGPEGAVESEFPLYAFVVALLFKVFGVAAWPGRVVSALAWTVLAITLYSVMRRQAGKEAAWVSLGLLMTSQLAVLMSLSVAPDGLSAAFYMLAYAATVRYAPSGTRKDLFAMHGSTLLAALAKPLALQVGLVQALGFLIGWRRRLREPLLWLGWAVIVGITLAWLIHGHQIFLETGNTFGVFLNGDTKSPRLRHLLAPSVHRGLFMAQVHYGSGLLGMVAVVYLAWRRALRPLDWSSLAAVGLGLYVSLRYSSVPQLGPHYHVFGLIHGSMFVGLAIAHARKEGHLRLPWPRYVVAAYALVSLVFAVSAGRAEFAAAESSDALALGADLRAQLEPGDLLLVRSPKVAYDEFWARRQNYEEPLAFCAAKARGYVIPRDAMGSEPITAHARRGARYYVEPGPRRDDDPELYRYLETHGEKLRDDERGRVWKLSSP